MVGALQFDNRTVLACHIVSWDIINISQDIYQVRLFDINNYIYIGFQGSYNGVIKYIEELKKKLTISIIQMDAFHYFSVPCTITVELGEIRFPKEITYDDKPIVGADFQRTIATKKMKVVHAFQAPSPQLTRVFESDIAAFDKDGNIIGKSVGEAAITITNNKLSETYTLVVLDTPNRTKFENMNYKVEKTDRFIPKILSNGTPISDNIPREYIVENPNIISIDANGEVTALASGTSRLIAKILDVTIFTNIEVAVKPPQVVKRNTGVITRNNKQLTMPVTPDFTGERWVSEQPSIVSVVEGTGVITGQLEGVGIVKGYRTTPFEAQCVEYTVSVNDPPPAPQLVRKEINIAVNDTYNGEMPPHAEYSGEDWSSSKPLIATVDAEHGLIKGKSRGQAVITGKYNQPILANAIEYTVNVLQKPVIDPKNLQLAANQDFQAVMPPSADFSEVRWSSDNNNVQVDPITGKIVAKSVGRSIVTGRFTKPFEVEGERYIIEIIELPPTV